MTLLSSLQAICGDVQIDTISDENFNLTLYVPYIFLVVTLLVPVIPVEETTCIPEPLAVGTNEVPMGIAGVLEQAAISTFARKFCKIKSLFSFSKYINMICKKKNEERENVKKYAIFVH